MIRVVDASVVIDAVLDTPRRDRAIEAMSGHELFAPGILDLEVISTLHRLERTARISAEAAAAALADLNSVPIVRMPIDVLTPAAWARRHSVRVADAFSVAAAAALGAELLTSVARLSRAPSLGIPLVLLI